MDIRQSFRIPMPNCIPDGQGRSPFLHRCVGVSFRRSLAPPPQLRQQVGHCRLAHCRSFAVNAPHLMK